MYLKFFAVTTFSSSLISKAMFHLVIITMSSSSIIKDSTCNITVKGVGVDDDWHHAPEDARVFGEEDWWGHSAMELRLDLTFETWLIVPKNVSGPKWKFEFICNYTIATDSYKINWRFQIAWPGPIQHWRKSDCDVMTRNMMTRDGWWWCSSGSDGMTFPATTPLWRTHTNPSLINAAQ